MANPTDDDTFVPEPRVDYFTAHWQDKARLDAAMEKFKELHPEDYKSMEENFPVGLNLTRSRIARNFALDDLAERIDSWESLSPKMSVFLKDLLDVVKACSNV